MTGVIWFVQIVHYPLFEKVGNHDFTKYEDEHKKLTTYIVAPFMLIELASSIFLFFTVNPFRISFIMINLALLVIIWLSTFFIQVPLHGKLSTGFNKVYHRYLVRTNWIRTICWTIRSLAVLIILIIK
jgi:uncharacterized membrane protein